MIRGHLARAPRPLGVIQLIAKPAAGHRPSLVARPVSRCCTCLQEQCYISVAESAGETEQVGALRAEAFYEDEPDSRVVQSNRRQFANQEARALRRRAGVVCLVAAAHSTQCVMASLDLHPPEAITGQPTRGVPSGEGNAAYLMNVAVGVEHRGQGVGKLLVQAAAGWAWKQWQASSLYVHAATDNEVARGLYLACGFREAAQEEQAQEGPGPAGRSTILLRLDLGSSTVSIPVQHG